MTKKDRYDLARRVWQYKLNYEPEEISHDAGEYWHKAMDWWIEILDLKPIIKENNEKWIQEYMAPVSRASIMISNE